MLKKNVLCRVGLHKWVEVVGSRSTNLLTRKPAYVQRCSKGCGAMRVKGA